MEHQLTLLLPEQDILTALYGDKVKIVDTLLYNLSDRVLAFHNADPLNSNDLDISRTWLCSGIQNLNAVPED